MTMSFLIASLHYFMIQNRETRHLRSDVGD